MKLVLRPNARVEAAGVVITAVVVAVDAAAIVAGAAAAVAATVETVAIAAIAGKVLLSSSPSLLREICVSRSTIFIPEIHLRFGCVSSLLPPAIPVRSLICTAR